MKFVFKKLGIYHRNMVNAQYFFIINIINDVVYEKIK